MATFKSPPGTLLQEGVGALAEGGHAVSGLRVEGVAEEMAGWGGHVLD